MQKVDLASDGHSHIKANSEQYLKNSFDLQLKLFTVFDADQPCLLYKMLSQTAPKTVNDS